MMRGVVLLCVLGTLVGGQCNVPRGADRRPNATSLVVASLNAAWLFDGRDDHPGSPWPAPDQAARHLQQVARMLARLDADIVALQEVRPVYPRPPRPGRSLRSAASGSRAPRSSSSLMSPTLI